MIAPSLFPRATLPPGETDGTTVLHVAQAALAIGRARCGSQPSKVNL
jgi:hypothetical protein